MAAKLRDFWRRGVFLKVGLFFLGCNWNRGGKLLDVDGSFC